MNTYTSTDELQARALGAGQKRLMVLLYERHAAGLPFPTVDEAHQNHLFSNRGGARNTYAAMEERGFIARSAYHWASGYFTPKGAKVAAYLHAHKNEIPARRKLKIRTISETGLTGTRHPQYVRTARKSSSPLLDGRGVSKLGAHVLKGRLRGAKVYYLTLEERATCPQTCAVWDICYGNGMVRATRWRHGPALLEAMEYQLDKWDSAKKRMQRLIRLHELGDFYSALYVRWWGDMLAAYPWLNVFGFTAHTPDSEIGAEIAALKLRFGDRFFIRWSNSEAPHGAVTIKHGEAKPADAFWCPEQDRKTSSCVTCGACWATNKAVAFKEH